MTDESKNITPTHPDWQSIMKVFKENGEPRRVEFRGQMYYLLEDNGKFTFLCEGGEYGLNQNYASNSLASH